MHLILRLAVVGTDSVAALVVSCELLLCLGYYLGLLLRACNYLDRCLFKLCSCDSLLIVSCRKQSRLINEVFKVCSCKADCRLCNCCKVNIGSKRLVSCVDLQNILSALYIGVADKYLSVKSARTKKCRVKDITSVGRSHNDD